MENNADFNRFALPVRWGIISGIAAILIFTLFSMLVISSSPIFGLFGMLFVTFVVMVVILILLGLQQRKAMGGYISIRDAFQAMFVAILIQLAISQIYSVIYYNFIDPDFFTRMGDAVYDMTIKLGGDETKAAEAVAEVEQQAADKNNFSKLILGFAKTIVFNSIIGLIIAAIIKRNKPEHLQA